MGTHQHIEIVANIDWKRKSLALFKSELSKLSIIYSRAKNNHRNCQVKRQNNKKKYQALKKHLEKVGSKIHEGLEKNIPNHLHYEFLSQQRILDVLEIRLKELTVNQTVLAFNKLSLKKRISHIEQACSYLQLESKPEMSVNSQCYDDTYHYLQQCDQDFPLLALPGSTDNVSEKENSTG